MSRHLDITGHTCEEANMFGVMMPSDEGPVPAPCGKPATHFIWHGRRERPYYMCDGCADHNIRNRGGISLKEAT